MSYLGFIEEDRELIILGRFFENNFHAKKIFL